MNRVKAKFSGSLPCLPEAAETDRFGGKTISRYDCANTAQRKFSGSLCQGLPETYRYDLKATQSAKVSSYGATRLGGQSGGLPQGGVAIWARQGEGTRWHAYFHSRYSGLTKIRTRRRAADSKNSTARRANAVLVFVNSL
ncbi:hypothetical protein ACF3NW_05855 [Eikenella halliae]|uniref:hypothetical protein n=1 Tax=Eikenella halliae TaxID=1795832 RepID=UPI0028D2C125|nr:hypothetical protein [Eikenella halliae]